MKIRLLSLDPKVTELIESNNQHELRIDVLSKQVSKLTVEMQKLKDENQRRKSSEF